MAKQATSFRLSSSALSLLNQLAESENRSLTNMVETLIQDKAKEKGISEMSKHIKQSPRGLPCNVVSEDKLWCISISD